MCTDLLAKAMVGYEGIWFKSLRFILNLNQILKIPISITLVQTPFMLPDKKTDILISICLQPFLNCRAESMIGQKITVG